MSSTRNQKYADAPRLLSGLLRRTLSLIEYYGHHEGRRSELLELRNAFNRAIECIEALEAAEEAALDPRHRKGPQEETVERRQRDEQQDKNR